LIIFNIVLGYNTVLVEQRMWKPLHTIQLLVTIASLVTTQQGRLFCRANDEAEPPNDVEKKQRTGTIIGIDLGTTYSCVAAFQNGEIQIIANDQGNRITPSYVAFTNSNERLVGDAAKNQATINPEQTIFDVKRLIGRQFYDDSVQADAKLLPFKLTSVDGRPFIQIQQGGSTFTYAPEEISAMVLQKLKQTAESFLGKTVDRAVITVPAYFNDAQRHATKDAGAIAGLHVERIINEPTAAAMAYGMDKEEEQNILVFDLGGGTFDVTVLTIDEGIFQVLSTNGDTHLGGSDFDQQIMTYYLDMLEKRNKSAGIRKNSRALQKLRKEVERVKRALSSQLQAHVEIEDLIPGVDLSETLTRAKFEELNSALFKKTLVPVKLAMEDAELDLDDIDEIILVGGSTRIPKIQQLLSEFFNGKELHKGVNPDEAVAFGAALQGSILSGEGGETVRDIMLLDVTPLSLGTSIHDGIMSVLIKRGTTIPTEKSSTYHTLDDNQSEMKVDVYEGERSMVKDNHFLGDFDMINLPPAPKGKIEVEVTFKLDADGLLEVTAENKSTNDKKHITITPETNRLSQEEIDRMIEEAAKHTEEDKRIVERLQARDRLESYSYQLSSTLEENDGKMPKTKEFRGLVEAIEETLQWFEANEDADKEDFDDKYKELQQLADPVMKQLYAGNNAEEQQGSDFDSDSEL
jgi:heat shock protein 5